MSLMKYGCHQCKHHLGFGSDGCECDLGEDDHYDCCILLGDKNKDASKCPSFDPRFEDSKPKGRKPYVGLRKLNYREQPELRCCDNCKHGNWNSDYNSQWLECTLTTKNQDVSTTGVCDEFEPKKAEG